MRPRGPCGLLLCLAVLAASAVVPLAAQEPTHPQLHALRAANPPAIDGVLDDEIWQSAPLQTGEWLTYSPLNGDRVPQTTTAWFAYDNQYLYFAFKCDDPEPAAIKTSVTRRDNAFPDDWVAISLDALGTGQLAYHMFINPSGMQMDALNSVAGNEDFSPDWLWDSAGRLTDTGYAVEVRLPIQSIRFKGGHDQRMGLMFFRRVSRLGKSVSWPPMPAGQWVFEHHASLMFDDITSRPVRELLPSVTFSQHQIRETPSAWAPADNHGDVGFSAKVGLTSTVTLDATVNPDFSQVESDAFQLELNRRFPIFFSEKRPFFMEGTGVFAMAGSNGDNSLVTAVHTRRIVDPSFGAKLTGSVGRITFGGLSALDTAGDDDRLFNIGRVQYSIGPSNYVGALVTDMSSSVEHNSVAGADFKWRVSPTQRIQGVTYFSRSSATDAGTKVGAAAIFTYSFETDKWGIEASGEHYDRDFEMATAFLNRVGLSGGSVFVVRSFYPDKKKYGWLPRLAIVSFSRGGDDRLAGGGEFFNATGLRFNLTRQGFLRVQQQVGFEHWAGRRFKTGGPNAFGAVQLFRWMQLNGGISSGPAVYYDPENPFQGHNFGLALGITLQPSGRFSQELGLDHTDFTRESGERVFKVDIINTKATYQFTRAFSTRAIVQYDGSRRRILTDLLSSYEPHPGTVVYVGYGSLIEQRAFIDHQWVPLTGSYAATTRGLFLKASYLYRF